MMLLPSISQLLRQHCRTRKSPIKCELSVCPGSHQVSAAPLSSRETCQLFRDIALGIRTLRNLDETPWADALGATMVVGADGWIITLRIHEDGRFHCERCASPDGRVYAFDSSQRYGTDPIELLSTWELARLATLLGEM